MRRRPTPGVVFKRAEKFFFLVVSRFSGLGTAILGSIVVRQFVYCERLGYYRADVPCCTNKICLLVTIQTGRCGRIFFFNLFVAELECKYRVCAWSFVVVRHCIIVNVSGVLK